MSSKTDRRSHRPDHHQLKAAPRMVAKRLPQGERHPVYACLINEGWETEGMAVIHLARSTGQERLTLVSFLVDVLGFGLKDAWGSVDLSISEFRSTVREMEITLNMVPAELDLARRLVFGGIADARRHGFRLPDKLQHWTNVLGQPPEEQAADTSLFGRDGQILIMCSEAELEERLVDGTVDDFLERPDVEFCLGPDLREQDSDELVEAEACLQAMEANFLDAIRRWCFATQQQPHPLLTECVQAMMQVIMQSMPEDLELEGDLDVLSEDERANISRRVIDFLYACSPHPQVDIDAALAQFFAFIKEFNSVDELVSVLRQEEEATCPGPAHDAEQG